MKNHKEHKYKFRLKQTRYASSGREKKRYGGLCDLRLRLTLSTTKLLATHENNCDLDSVGAGGSKVV